jgi:peptidoglycan biosynthesis protein MviN/MurJ (putative lipid II flippase)
MNLLWLLQSESYKKGMLLSVIFNIAAKFLLFLLTICIARLFGSNIKTDIYFFIYGTMVLLAGSVNAVDTSVIIPESMRLRASGGNNAATAFLNYFIRLYCGIGTGFILLVFFFGTSVFAAVSKFSVQDIEVYKSYFILGACYFLFQLLINYINAILISLKYFTMPMLASGINSCIVIGGSLLLYKQYDILSVLISGLAAYTANLFFLLYMLNRTGWNFFTCNSSVEKRIWSKLWFSQIGQLATLASSYFPLYLLSGFGSGIISTMNYGKNIADIPNSLVTAQVANVSGIKMNEQAALGENLNDIFTRATKLLLFILVPTGCYMFVFARPLVEFFYKTGNFAPEAITAAAFFLQLLAITIFSIGINAMVTRIFIAMQIIKEAFFYKIIMNGLLIVVMWLFSKYYGPYGYPYAVIFINSLNVITLFFICKKFFKTIAYSHILKYTALMLMVNIPLAALLWYVLQATTFFYLYQLLAGAVIYFIVMVLINKIKQFRIL